MGGEPGLSWQVLISGLVHLALVESGKWHNEENHLKFTDIDYAVFTGGQETASRQPPLNTPVDAIPGFSSFLTDSSPYARATYRYSPVMGLLTMPNQWFGSETLGKYVFCAFNMLTFILIKKCLVLYKVNDKVISILLALAAFNPVVIQVAARGNSDSTMTLLVIICLWLYKQKRFLGSAIVLGLAIHVKMYPILFLVPMTIAMNPQTNAVIVLGQICKPVMEIIKRTERITPVAAFVLSLKLAVYIMLIPFMFVYEFAMNRMNKQQWLFATMTAATAISLTFGVYFIYGWTALYEGFLYHLIRHDHRHNMSIVSTWATLVTPQRYYGRQATGFLSATPYKILLFLTNKVLVLFAGIGLAHVSLPLALFVQTTLFVAFNGVITVQYFVWYATLLPLAIATAPGFQAIHTQRATLLALRPLLLVWIPLWLASIIAWVWLSDKFEGHGSLKAFFAMIVPNATLLASHLGMVAFVLQPAPTMAAPVEAANHDSAKRAAD